MWLDCRSLPSGTFKDLIVDALIEQYDPNRENILITTGNLACAWYAAGGPKITTLVPAKGNFAKLDEFKVPYTKTTASKLEDVQFNSDANWIITDEAGFNRSLTSAERVRLQRVYQAFYQSFSYLEQYPEVIIPVVTGSIMEYCFEFIPRDRLKLKFVDNYSLAELQMGQRRGFEITGMVLELQSAAVFVDEEYDPGKFYFTSGCLNYTST